MNNVLKKNKRLEQHSAKKFQRPSQLKYSAFSEKNVALQANTNLIEAQSN
ncbi:hypothetical protein SynPROSU1_01084 [Synechococcus sp. PROS-U-1]|nr:hypothetical protein SynPROSU1_01084 [Synechococcus sp. PROS-U-1]